MSQNDTASRADLAAAALADLFDEEIRAMGDAGIADIECRALELGHKAMAAALGRALERYDLRLCSSLPEGAGVHDRRGRTLATKMGDVTFEWTRVRAADGGIDVPLADAVRPGRGRCPRGGWPHAAAASSPRTRAAPAGSPSRSGAATSLPIAPGRLARPPRYGMLPTSTEAWSPSKGRNRHH